MALTNLTWVSSGYGWLAIVAPILIAAPVYFTGNLSFGGLMMAVGAFNQVNAALRWYIDNFGAIAGWKATLLRVSAFRNALMQMDVVEKHGMAINLDGGESGDQIVLSGLQVCDDAGVVEMTRGFRLREEEVRVAAGGRLMVNGDQGVNRRLLFAAMAGLWPWGSGHIGMPVDKDTLFIPQHGYLPAAPLREILAYPRPPADFTNEEYVAALERCGLAHFVVLLDDNIRWDRKLSPDDQAAVRVANAMLLKPRWIVIDDVLEGLGTDTQELLSSVLAAIDGAAIVYIGRSEVFLKVLTPQVAHLELLQSKSQ
jgi:putative ATP-binding cassette transporter